MSLQTLNRIMESPNPQAAILNETIDAAVSDIYSMKHALTGYNTRSENIVKLLKSLKNPPEKYICNG